MSTRDRPRTIDEIVAYIDEKLRRLGLDWSTSPTPIQFLYDAKGDILVALGDNDAQRLPVGADGEVLTALQSEPLGVKWIAPAGPPFTAKAQIWVGLGPGSGALLGPGSDGQILLIDETAPLGMRWADCDCAGGGGGGGGMGAMAFAVVNESTVVTNDDAATMTAAVSRQVIEDLAPAWNGLGAGVTFYPGGAGTVPAGAIVVTIADDSDVPGDAGYHTVDGDQPVAFVFAKTITDGGGGVLTAGGGFATYCVAQVLSHEICETYVDPKIQELADDFASHAWIVEVGDVASEFGYVIDGVQMSDFGLPSWFDPNGTTPFSHADAIPGPFSLAAGSYCFRYDTSGGTTEHGAQAPAVPEILVANPEVMREQDWHKAMLSTSIVRARRARGLPDPVVRAVEGRPKDWTPGS